MSGAANRRRLDRIERRQSVQDRQDAFLEAAYGADALRREQRAAAAAALPPPEEPAAPSIPPELRADGPTGERQWSTTVRPGPHDILTWQEALRVPWVEGSADDEA